MKELSYRQWVNLGIASGDCMPVPDFCGMCCVALAFWMRPNANCSTTEGILSSHSSVKTGFTISCHSGLKLVHTNFFLDSITQNYQPFGCPIICTVTNSQCYFVH